MADEIPQLPDNARTIVVPHAKVKTDLPFYAKPNGPQPHTKVTLYFDLDYQDYLLLSGSKEEGFMLCITPLRQPLPDEDNTQQWSLPEGGLEPPDGPATYRVPENFDPDNLPTDSENENTGDDTVNEGDTGDDPKEDDEK